MLVSLRPFLSQKIYLKKKQILATLVTTGTAWEIAVLRTNSSSEEVLWARVTAKLLLSHQIHTAVPGL